jgi:TPR repeat protein
MDSEDHKPSNETKTPTSLHLISQTPNTEGRLADECNSEISVSFCDQNAVSSVRSRAQRLKAAADQGFAEAQFNYGVCLCEAKGVSIDFGRAVHYFKLAADQGIAAAQLN